MKNTKRNLNSTPVRRASYSLMRDYPRSATALSRLADDMQGKEPLSWQPAGSIQITDLMKQSAK